MKISPLFSLLITGFVVEFDDDIYYKDCFYCFLQET